MRHWEMLPLDSLASRLGMDDKPGTTEDEIYAYVLWLEDRARTRGCREAVADMNLGLEDV